MLRSNSTFPCFQKDLKDIFKLRAFEHFYDDHSLLFILYIFSKKLDRQLLLDV